MTGPRDGRGVLDTNIVILLDRLSADDLPSEPVTTAVTVAELSVGPLVTDDPREQAVRQVRLQQVEASLEALPFDRDAARAYGRAAAGLRRVGRKTGARAFDVLIAATALSQGLPLFTTNPDDFRGIEGLELVAVPHPDGA